MSALAMMAAAGFVVWVVKGIVGDIKDGNFMQGDLQDWPDTGNYLYEDNTPFDTESTAPNRPGPIPMNGARYKQADEAGNVFTRG